MNGRQRYRRIEGPHLNTEPMRCSKCGGIVLPREGRMTYKKDGWTVRHLRCPKRLS